MAHIVDGRARQKFNGCRLAFRQPLRFRRRRHGVGFKVVDRGGHFRARHTVDRRVMHFGDDRETAFGQTFDIIETFNDREFPQGPRRVHGPRVQARHLNAELPPVAGLGQGDMADVIFDVEVRVFEPVGMIEAQRHAHDALAERARHMQPRLVVFQNFLEAQNTALDGGLVIDRHTADMHGRVRCFEIQERGIHRA